MTTNNLVVDLDNSLLKIDIFKEILGKSLLKRPHIFFKTVILALRNIKVAKIFISKECKIEFQTLPFENRIIDIITRYKKKGYKVVLATGTPHSYANPIANYLKLFDKVIATDEKINNTGLNKLDAIKDAIGGDFIYLGDSKKDMPIWLYCKKAILVGNNNPIKKKLIKNNVEIIDDVKKEKSIITVLIKQLRVYQWSKNFLLFVPALASHKLMDDGLFINTLQGFIAFCFLASGIYVINDIIDVDNDRKHPEKKIRPIAAGDLSISSAYLILLFCVLVGGWLAIGLGTMFFFIAIGYIILNLLYAFYFKSVAILDVVFLMTFYTLRLIAGHVPDLIPLSPWLLSFSIFLFFSLGLMKRYVDIILMEKNNINILIGRGYSIHDSKILMSLGVGSGLLSTLVLILYTGSQQVQQNYSTPMLLVGLAPVMLYWISRMWLMAGRGMIKSDPVLFTLKDIHSYAVAFCFLLLMLISNYIVL